MIVCKVELWPKGDESKATRIGEIRIANDATGNSTVGNYTVKLMKSAPYTKNYGIFRESTVKRFPRMRLGPYDLLFRALRSCIGERNPVELETNHEDNLSGHRQCLHAPEGIREDRP